jgi:glycerol-3-phosphate acyltransferase PlsY
MLVLSPISALFGFLGFVFTFLFSRIASLSSIVGLILSAVCYLVMNSTGVHLFVGAAIIFLILIRHEANIDALLDNREKIFQ